MPGLRHLNMYSTCAPGKMMQHDLHHGELVQVGVEQAGDDHAQTLRVMLPRYQRKYPVCVVGPDKKAAYQVRAVTPASA